MSVQPWGHRKGGLIPVEFPVADAATSGIAQGDFVVFESANPGYIVPAAAGELPIGVALDGCDAPTSDGGATVRVNISLDAIYEYPPDAGTVTAALVGTTMDVGGAQSVNIDASADDVLTVVGVNTERNTVLVRLTPTFLGVV